MLRAVTATRYVTPLREGGSLPGLTEADDDGLYVVKFRGAGQGLKALVAEVIVGELARALGLLVPELVADRARSGARRRRAGSGDPGPDRRERGLNLGVDFLPGALAYVPGAGVPPDPELAADVVWLDALTTNVDRTPRNPNLLVWHGRMWLIDHGAALYLHHQGLEPRGTRPAVRAHAEHVLLPYAGSLTEAHERNAPRITPRAARTDRRARPCRTGSVRPTRRSTSTISRGVPRTARSRTRRSMPEPTRSPFSYAILRVVPRIERGERFNVGVVVFCRQRDFLGLRTYLDPVRLRALAPEVDAAQIEAQLVALTHAAAADPRAGAIAALPASERFGWLVAPSSTMIQPSEVHTGLCEDPEATLDALFAELVSPVDAPASPR